MIVLLSKILLVTYVITEIIRRPIFELKLKLKTKNKYVQFFLSKLYCWYCVTFWVSLYYTMDIFMSSFLSVSSMIIQYLISIYKDYKLIKKNKNNE